MVDPEKSPSPGTVKLVLPLTKLPLSQNGQRRAHWTEVRDKKLEVEWLVSVAVKKAGVQKIDGPVSVRLIWYAPNVRIRDCDSMGPMMKACLDQIVREGILADDHSEIVREVHLGPIWISRDNPRFELHIRRVPLAG